MSQLDRTEIDPRVCNGKAVIQGTRIPVLVVLGQIAIGESWDDLIRGYPELKKEDIQVPVRFLRQRDTEPVERHRSGHH